MQGWRWHRVLGSAAPYLRRPGDGRGWLGGHSRFSCGQGTDCQSAGHTHYKGKNEGLAYKTTGNALRNIVSFH